MRKKTVVAEIEELHGMSVKELQSRYQALFGNESHIRSRAWLTRRCAWKIQENRFGGLSPQAKDRLEELISEVRLPIGNGRTVKGQLKKPESGALESGMVLIRNYKGRKIRVEVRETGFEWDGVLFKSLSAVARAVTGSRWNGKLFFNLTSRKTKS